MTFAERFVDWLMAPGRSRDSLFDKHGQLDEKAYVQYRLKHPIEGRTYEAIPLIDRVFENRRGTLTKVLRIRDAVYGVRAAYALYPFAKLVRFCRDYDQDVYLEKFSAEKGRERVSTDNILNLMSLEIIPGGCVDILVFQIAQAREAAEELALKIYAGITTIGEEPDFDRLEVPIRIP